MIQIDWISILLGVLALAYGVYSFVQRSKNPETFGKLLAMKKMFGKTAGNIIHLVFYSLLPFVISVMMFLKAFGIHA